MTQWEACCATLGSKVASYPVTYQRVMSLITYTAQTCAAWCAICNYHAKPGDCHKSIRTNSLGNLGISHQAIRVSARYLLYWSRQIPRAGSIPDPVGAAPKKRRMPLALFLGERTMPYGSPHSPTGERSFSIYPSLAPQWCGASGRFRPCLGEQSL
jgi:hypothetical protein